MIAEAWEYYESLNYAIPSDKNDAEAAYDAIVECIIGAVKRGIEEISNRMKQRKK